MRVPSSFRSFLLLITDLGHPIATMLTGIGIAIVGLTQSNVRLVIAGGAVWFVLGVGSLLKLLFSRARPHTAYAANIWLDKHSFPSGHTTGSTAAYGLLAYFAWELLAWPWNGIIVIVLSLFIVLVGYSRVYLGAHFPSDVIAGWLLGAVAVICVIFVVHPLNLM